jgi:hypothetical protein
MKAAICLVLVLISQCHLMADETNQEWIHSGHFQLRTDIDGRDFDNRTHTRIFTSMRTRYGVEKWFGEQVGFNVQLQDSRVFGEEVNTITPIGGVDIHQAYAQLRSLFNSPFDFQAGRFEMSYGTERFFGALGWHYVGRAFDGAKLIYKGFADIDVFGLTVSNNVKYIPIATASAYADTLSTESSSIYGFWAKRDIGANHRVDLFSYYEINTNKNASGRNLIERLNLGLNHIGRYGALNSLFEASIQTGSLGGKDLFAYLVSLAFTYNFKYISIGTGIDMLSGTDEDEDSRINTYSQDYGTNHKFYGYMDYFINLPVNTGNLGLNDIYINCDFKPKESKFSASLNFHYFMTNKENGENKNFLGQEVDLTLRYAVVKGVSLILGGSVFLGEDLMRRKFIGSSGELPEDPAFWTYFMLSAGF